MTSAVAGAPVVAGVPTVDDIHITVLSPSFGVLLLFGFPAVLNISCAAVGPANLVFLIAVNAC
jgi:hypothetical protein